MRQKNKDIYQKFHEHREEESLADAVFCLLMAMTDDETFCENVTEDVVYGWEPKDSHYIVDCLYEIASGYDLALSETI